MLQGVLIPQATAVSLIFCCLAVAPFLKVKANFFTVLDVVLFLVTVN